MPRSVGAIDLLTSSPAHKIFNRLDERILCKSTRFGMTRQLTSQVIPKFYVPARRLTTDRAHQPHSSPPKRHSIVSPPAPVALPTRRAGRFTAVHLAPVIALHRRTAARIPHPVAGLAERCICQQRARRVHDVAAWINEPISMQQRAALPWPTAQCACQLACCQRPAPAKRGAETAPPSPRSGGSDRLSQNCTPVNSRQPLAPPQFAPDQVFARRFFH